MFAGLASPLFRSLIALCAALLTCSFPVCATEVRFKERCLNDLVGHVARILATQDGKTGRFGKGMWIVTDQNVILPLAAAWATPSPGNPYYHSPVVLDAIMAGGDALIDDQDANGQWVFRTKDGSTWGNIYMPWTYTRWIRTFSLIREAMPADRRIRWEKGLRLGYAGIAKELSKGTVHNIAAHHAMGLWFAGQVFDKPEWRDQAAGLLRKVAAAQHRDGYWTENNGPVVAYGFVYLDALGVYNAVSRDPQILPVLKKSAIFHSYFTYPDGSDVETIDERNYYHPGVRLPNVGLTLTPEGRAYVDRQLSLWKGAIPADEAASLLLWGQEGGADIFPTIGNFDYILGAGSAAVYRRGPWYIVISAITAPVPSSRWHMDRQNFVSVFHDKTGLLIGGGNTKVQPAWSSFTAGNIAAFRLQPDTVEPIFQPPTGVVHIPTAAVLAGNRDIGVDLTYRKLTGTIRIAVKSADLLEYTVSGDADLTAHLVLLPGPDRLKILMAPDGLPLAGRADTRATPAVHLSTPAGASLRREVSPFNPYARDGRAGPQFSRTVVDIPLDKPKTAILRVTP